MKKAAALKKFREFAEESEITGEDALRLGKEVSESVARRHKVKKKVQFAER